MTQPRVIITLKVLRETLTNAPEIFFQNIVCIFALDYESAKAQFTDLYDEIAETNPEAASVWTDLRNALNNMSTLERDRLRDECRSFVLDLVKRAT